MQFVAQSKNVEMFGVSEASDMSIAMTGKVFYALISGLYSNKIDSIVRESIANAKDGHIKRGNPDRPSFVHAPTVWEPFYSVRDYGCSMDHETVMRRYTTIGWSSKEDSNDEMGTFGFGSKAPFSYTSQFSVTCWAEGERRIYNCHIGEDGKPRIALMDRGPSEEEQGLMVRFDVKGGDIQKFQTAIRYTALAHAPCFECNVAVRSCVITADHGDFYYTEDATGPLVQMGCVWYPINFDSLEDSEELKQIRSDGNLVIRTKIGDLRPTPSRETLEYTPATVRYLTDKLVGLYRRMQQEVTDKLNEQPDLWSTISYYREHYVGKGILNWIASHAQAKHACPKDDESFNFRLGSNDHVMRGDLHLSRVLKLSKRCASVERGIPTAVYLIDDKKPAVKSVNRRIQEDMKARGIEYSVVARLPDPETQVKAQAKFMKLNSKDRDERINAMRGLHKNLWAARGNIAKDIADYQCPVVILAESLPEPPKAVREKSAYMATYAHNSGFTDKFGVKTSLRPSEDHVNLVFPLDRGRFEFSFDVKALNIIASHYGHALGQVLGVARTNFKRFLANNPEFFSYKDVFNPAVIDLTALEERMNQLANFHDYDVSEHRTYAHTLKRRVLNVLHVAPPGVKAYVESFALASSRKDLYTARRKALETSGLDFDNCKKAWRLVTGENFERVKESVIKAPEVAAVEENWASLKRTYPKLQQIVGSYSPEIDPAVYLLGWEAKRQQEALSLYDPLDCAA
jgi:hypothetical protein